MDTPIGSDTIREVLEDLETPERQKFFINIRNMYIAHEKNAGRDVDENINASDIQVKRKRLVP